MLSNDPASRTDFFGANKEGIYGTIGYLFIQLIGIQTGKVIQDALWQKKRSQMS